MARRLAGRLSYANVVATLALFIALGGSSYAAVQLTRGSVKTQHIARGAVTGIKVKNGTLRKGDFRTGVLLKGEQGPAGPAGSQGPTGPQGVQGVPGPTEGVGSTGGSAAPSASFEISQASQAIQTDATGKLFVYGKATLSVDCTVGNPRTGLYVDGVAVAGTGYSYTANTSTYVTVAGVSAELAAGAHNVVLGTDCVGGDWEVVTSNHQAVTAVALGG
jgi:hypothetical protein